MRVGEAWSLAGVVTGRHVMPHGMSLRTQLCGAMVEYKHMQRGAVCVYLPRPSPVRGPGGVVAFCRTSRVPAATVTACALLHNNVAIVLCMGNVFALTTNARLCSLLR